MTALVEWHPDLPEAAECWDRLRRLTPRQREVVGLLAGGHTAKEIGRLLGIAVSTVQNTVGNACKTLGMLPASRLPAFVALASTAAPEVEQAPLTPVERLTAETVHDPVSGCWVFPEERVKVGGGAGAPPLARNVAYAHWHGPFDSTKLEVVPSCGNGSCVAPAHLELVSRNTGLPPGMRVRDLRRAS